MGKPTKTKKSESDLVKRSWIFTDEPETEILALDFNIYSKTIASVIKESKPQFTVGIFGEWGSGKTTLLLDTKKVLKNGNCNVVGFNA